MCRSARKATAMECQTFIIIIILVKMSGYANINTLFTGRQPWLRVMVHVAVHNDIKINISAQAQCHCHNVTRSNN